MHTLSKQEVRRIAGLANLELDDDEVQQLQSELSTILAHMEQISMVETDGVEPLTHAVEMSMRRRDDLVAPSLPQEIALKGAPDQQEGQFRVPAVLPAKATP